MSTQKDIENDTKTIIERIKSVEAVSKDKDVAELLGIDQRNLATAKSRGIVPYEKLVRYSRKSGTSLDYIHHGRGPQKLERIITVEGGAAYHICTDQDAVYRIAEQVYLAAKTLDINLPADKFANTVRLLHRDLLDRGENDVSQDRVNELVKFAVG
ncbi:MAG: helix-turn-helix domain containing protein [Gammaproteobacteria bacterium]|nr:helix-turn-helix domain containing protein [Gammaproteobacteria bacterium]